MEIFYNWETYILFAKLKYRRATKFRPISTTKRFLRNNENKNSDFPM